MHMEKQEMSRRSFVKVLGTAGVLATAGVGLGDCMIPAAAWAEGAGDVPEAFASPTQGKKIECMVDPETGELVINKDVVIRYGGCLGCYSACGNRVRIDRATGEVLGIAGNPYNPNCAYPYLNFEEPLEEAYLSMTQLPGKGNALRGTICGRGQATWDAYNQSDRITSPLKRAGARGEGKWRPISWEQLIKEVTEGGKIFEELGEDIEVEGFIALRDPETPMNPEDPALGPVSNQIVELGGRGDGRGNINARFMSAYGSINSYGHGSTCGGSKIVNTYQYGSASLYSDIESAEYILWMGTFPGANGKCYQGIAARVVEALESGRAKMDVVDPVLGNGCVTPAQQGIAWHPIKPATNTAFAMGLVRWMVDNNAYNVEYLAIPSYAAACEAGYASCCNATWLVIDDEASENNRKFMRAEDAGLEVPEPEDPEKPPTHYVVIDAQTGEPALHRVCPSGQIEFEGEVNGIHVRSAFMYLKDEFMTKTVEEWAEVCDMDVDTLVGIAQEFTSHGTKASVTGMGSTAAENGLDNAVAYEVLNSMVGSNQMTGGTAPRRIGGSALGNGARYLLSTIEGAPSIQATRISRTGKGWHQTGEYQRRIEAGEEDPKPFLPWYGLAGAADNQALISICYQYPYQAKILISWETNTLQATPGAIRDEILDKLKDTSVVPLHIACDVVVGEHANLADYIVPDTNPFETFGVVTQEGYWPGKGNTVRWPTTRPKTAMTADGRHMSYEVFLADVAAACGLPGWNEDAIADVDGNTYPLRQASDYFLKGIANLAFDGEPVSDITDEEIELQALDTLPEHWKEAVAEQDWPKVLKVLSRGGRFWPIEQNSDGAGHTAYAKEHVSAIYFENRAIARNSATGARRTGSMAWVPEAFNDGTPIEEMLGGEFPLKVCQYKPRFRSITMLANSPVMRDICKHNYHEINSFDAADRGIVDGDEVVLTNPTGDRMPGIAMVRDGVARGTVGSAFGYGHIAYGAQDVQVDDVLVPGDPAIGAGVHVSCMLDPTVEGAVFPLADNEAAAPGRNGGFYQIEKA